MRTKVVYGGRISWSHHRSPDDELFHRLLLVLLLLDPVAVDPCTRQVAPIC